MIFKNLNHEDLVSFFKYKSHFRKYSLHLGQLSACIQKLEEWHKISVFSSLIATLCNRLSTSSLVKNLDPNRNYTISKSKLNQEN